MMSGSTLFLIICDTSNIFSTERSEYCNGEVMEVFFVGIAKVYKH